MRLAPVPLAFRRDFELAIHNAGENSRIEPLTMREFIRERADAVF
jgi:hypothetical protein